MQVISKYEIETRLGCFVMNSAGNNNTMMDAIENPVPGVGRNRRLRCVGHILNFIIKAISYGEGTSDFNTDISGASDIKAFAIWRRFGACTIPQSLDDDTLLERTLAVLALQ